MIQVIYVHSPWSWLALWPWPTAGTIIHQCAQKERRIVYVSTRSLYDRAVSNRDTVARPSCTDDRRTRGRKPFSALADADLSHRGPRRARFHCVLRGVFSIGCLQHDWKRILGIELHWMNFLPWPLEARSRTEPSLWLLCDPFTLWTCETVKQLLRSELYKSSTCQGLLWLTLLACCPGPNVNWKQHSNSPGCVWNPWNFQEAKTQGCWDFSL